MKKLKNKVFWLIFSILTVFLISILAIFNYQDYQREEKSIKANLTMVGNEHIKGEQRPPVNDENTSEDHNFNNSQPKIFMDNNVYTVILNDSGKIIDVTNHSSNDIEDEKIEEIAQSIIDKNNCKNKIGNLYFDDYEYWFKSDKTLTIIDNSKVKDKLLDNLRISILIFIVLEIIILYIALQLTSWIIKPVIDTFSKQKQFIADASHELKTPLAVIMASAEALENEPAEKKWLENIKDESARMSNIVTELLEMARLENAPKEQYAIENLSKIVEKSSLTQEGLMYEKNISLKCNIAEDIKLNCNSEKIKQLMSILLDNAIKHSNKNSEIEVILKKEKNNIVLEVKNQGEAIPKEEQEKIFERFYRADESRNRAENRYGLGLAIAKSIAENHNAKISAMSQDGVTTFKVNFKV